MIILENVEKKFENGIVGIKNINAKFKDKSVNLIVGHSGSGKTTLLQSMALLTSVTKGKVIFDNINANNFNNKEQVLFRRKNLGFIFQSYFLHDKLTALENVILPMYANYNISTSEIIQRGKDLLELVGVSSRENHYPKEMSGGEQQRVAIARAMANNPRYIFADEPTGNLDEENELKILSIIKNLSKEKCIVIVSHNKVAEEFADEIFEMQSGTIRRKDFHEKK